MLYFEQPENFKFKGFQPNKSLQQKCKTIYNLVEDRSPSEAAKEASLTKIGNNYQAKLKIISASCSFEVSSLENKASESMDKLYKKFTTKILHWNKNRECLSFTEK